MSIVGDFAIVLMVIVLIIAAASLVIVATIPIGNWLLRRRASVDEQNPQTSDLSK